jgi:hypothetical protein
MLGQSIDRMQYKMMISASAYASPTTEDDGYTYPDDANDEEKEEIDEQEQEAWEDAGSPGEQDNDSDDDGDVGDDGNDLPEPQQTFTCSDGSTVTGDDECPQTGPNPYCDKVGPDYRGSCHRKITATLLDYTRVMMKRRKLIGEIVKMQLKSVMTITITVRPKLFIKQQ